MNLICRAWAVTATATAAALVTAAASGCGGATPTAGPRTNGLETKSPADVLQAAAGALAGAKSVHLVGTGPGLRANVRIQQGSSTGTFTKGRTQIEVTVIGSYAYIKADQEGLKLFGFPPQLQRRDAGRWLKVPASNATGFSLASRASLLTRYYGPLEPKVRQATLDGKKVVVISWRDGSKLYVADTGPAYPLRSVFRSGPNAGQTDYTGYGVPVHITAPSGAISPY